jgi:L-aminopeptidase/D-esterase-like protein
VLITSPTTIGIVERLTVRDVPGIRVGHWTDATARTGCTVVLADDGGMVAGIDVRGAAPGTRETDLLRPTALVERINAICLAGGSAFGLAAADGVMRRLAERGIGFATGIRPVPIVPAAILFDLGVGDPDAYPTADAGHAATRAAEIDDGPLEGRVGAGTGATVAKLGGTADAHPSGVGSAARRVLDGHLVGALVITNALGDVHARDGRLLIGHTGRVATPRAGNTTLVVVATDAPLDRAQCRRLAEMGHDAIARGVRPAHTMFDGDVVFAASTADGSASDAESFLALALAADDAIGEAIERSVAP